MAMAISMAAMMAITAIPFFWAYARDTRRLTAVLTVMTVYVATWAALGALAGFVMDQLMMPTGIYGAVGALVFAGAWMLTPWARRARGRCLQMCMRRPRANGLREAALLGSAYTASCLVCSAGVMAALLLLGMSDLWLIGAGAAVLFLYKLGGWDALFKRPSLSGSNP